MLEEYVGYSNDLPDIENERERNMKKAIENKLLDDFCLQSNLMYDHIKFLLFILLMVLGRLAVQLLHSHPAPLAVS